MNKKVIIAVVSIVLAIIIAAFISASNNKIDDNKIYLFSQSTCPHCHHAISYISSKYPDLEIEIKDIVKGNNMQDFMACADKFNLKDFLGTPLICMGGNYIMGWSREQQEKFDDYVKPFLRK